MSRPEPAAPAVVTVAPAMVGTAMPQSAPHLLAATADTVASPNWVRGAACAWPVHFYNHPREARPAPRGEPAERRGGAAGHEPPPEVALRLAALLQPPLPELRGPVDVLTWPSRLLDYQRQGIAMLLSRPAVLLADDMGLGKTVQVAAALRLLFHQGQIQTALVVSPASLLHQWRSELTRWAPELRVRVLAGRRALAWQLPAHVKLVGYEALRADSERCEPVLPTDPWDVVVLDEASRIKNADSGISRACCQLPKRRAWLLTGTPLENSVDDLLPLLGFLGVLGTSGQGARGDLQRVQLRRRKAEVLPDLPPKRVIELPLRLGSGQRRAYLAAEREGRHRLSRDGPELSLPHILAQITRLKQLCNADPASGEAVKLADLRERLAQVSAAGHRALVFTQFVDEQYGAARVVRELAGFAPLALTGSLTPRARAEVVDRFRREPRHRVLILSTRAGGLGLNLQAASYVFHLDRWWNPAIEEQADSRAHRMGQVYPVTVYRYLCLDTIEERIDALLQAKRALFAQTVDEVSLDLATLDRDELLRLCGV